MERIPSAQCLHNVVTGTGQRCNKCLHPPAPYLPSLHFSHEGAGGSSHEDGQVLIVALASCPTENSLQLTGVWEYKWQLRVPTAQSSWLGLTHHWGPTGCPKQKELNARLTWCSLMSSLLWNLVHHISYSRRRGRWEKGHQCLSPDLDKVFKLALACTLFLRDQINWMASTPYSGWL